MINVVLVDDEQLIVRGLSRAFPWSKYGCQVVGTAADGREGLQLIRQTHPDILFTDIRMPNMDGLSMIAALKSEFPTLQIAVLTAFRDFDYAQHAIRLGVCRYLLKPSRMDELHEAVQTMVAHLQMNPSEQQAPVACDEDESGSFVAHNASKFIQQHCTEHLTLNDVAEHVYVSQWHLSKLINRYARQSFFDLLNGYRIARSQGLLSDPSLRISEVAISVGYADVAHFSRIFKKVTGKTPMEYRSGIK